MEYSSKTEKDLMSMLSLNKTIDKLAIANSTRWYSHALRREEGHVFRRAF